MENSELQNKIIAHRGESFLAPENTLSAINLAWEKGAKCVEIDIQLTSDNHIVVYHDLSTKRIGNRNTALKKQTLAQLQELDAGSHKNSIFKDEKIPTLNEALNTLPNYGKIVIELKCGSEVIPYLKEVLENYSFKSSQIEFIAFNFDTICEIKKHFPKHKSLWLLDLDYELPHWLVWFNSSKTIKKIKQHNLDGVDVWGGKFITEKFVSKFKNEGLLLYIWTVNNAKQAEQYLSLGVDGVTTDKANWLLEKLTK